uniref:TIGR00269 family protein n=2 Tax=Thermofilum pendens TaxID=2269 RepID=A0A7J3X655_THEPE
MGGTVRCFVCGGRASVYVSYLGEYLCSYHFVEYFERRVKATLTWFRLVEPGDRVAVAVSGGKDSLTTLYLMRKFSEEMGFEVFGIAVDEGIAGYREYKLEALRSLAREIGVDVHIATFRELFGLTLDEAVAVLGERGLKVKPCTVCGVFRRYALNRAARELGATKLATGHNLDDEVQVFAMNLVKAHVDGIVREGLATEPAGERLVPRIKPLYFIPEKEVLAYTLIRGIRTPFVECPYIVHALRHPMRHWLNEIEDEEPGTKYRVLAVKELFRNILPPPPKEMMLCRVCGEPTSHPVCRACELKTYLLSARVVPGQR